MSFITATVGAAEFISGMALGVAANTVGSYLSLLTTDRREELDGNAAKGSLAGACSLTYCLGQSPFLSAIKVGILVSTSFRGAFFATKDEESASKRLYSGIVGVCSGTSVGLLARSLSDPITGLIFGFIISYVVAKKR